MRRGAEQGLPRTSGRGPRAIALCTLALLMALVPRTASGQADGLPLAEDAGLSAELAAIAREAGLTGSFDVGSDGTEEISFAVIDLNGPEPRYGGVNADNFIYPASVYKMYVAAEVLRRVEEGSLDLTSEHVMAEHNAVDTAREVLSDPRPLLRGGDTVTIGYLLDLMITRSDNSAANALIDVAGRPAIDSLLHRYGWHGSEVTRKFLSRAVEDPGYAEVRGTETSARHAAEFMYLAATDRLVSPWVSRRLMILLGGQLDDTKLGTGLPRSAVFYHKSGWWSYWTNDVGVVMDGDVRYVISLFTPLREEESVPRMRRVAEAVHALMTRRDRSGAG